MSDKDELERYFLQGIGEKVYTSDTVENIFLVFVMSMPLLIWKINDIAFLSLGILPLVLQIVATVKLIRNGKIEEERLILYRGLTPINLSLVWELSGIALSLYIFQGKWKFIITSIGIMCYIIAAILYAYMTKRSIDKILSGNAKKANKSVLPVISGTASGGLGILIYRTFFQGISQDAALKMLCFMGFFMASVAVIRIGNIIKYCYIIDNKEWLEIDDEVKDDYKENRKKEKSQIFKILAVGLILGIALVAIIWMYDFKYGDPYGNLSYIHESADNISDEYHKIEGLEALLEYYSEEKLSTIDQISIRAVAEAAICAWQQCDNEKMPAFKVPITNDCDDIRIINADMSRFPNAFETLLATDFLPLASEEFKDAEYIAVEIDEVTGNATVEVIKKDKEYSCVYTYTAEAEGGKYYLESAYWIKMIQSGKY